VPEKQKLNIMKKLQILGLGQMVTDTASNIKGMLVIFQMDMSNNQNYLFQPSALSPETRMPVKSFWIDKNRILGGNEEEVELPLEVLGTHVEDKATGFNGTAVAFSYHLNGCTHFGVKAKGVIEKTGESIGLIDFDIRRLKGDAIKELSKEEFENSKKQTPSPVETRPFTPGSE